MSSERPEVGKNTDNLGIEPEMVSEIPQEVSVFLDICLVPEALKGDFYECIRINQARLGWVIENYSNLGCSERGWFARIRSESAGDTVLWQYLGVSEELLKSFHDICAAKVLTQLKVEQSSVEALIDFLYEKWKKENSPGQAPKIIYLYRQKKDLETLNADLDHNLLFKENGKRISIRDCLGLGENLSGIALTAPEESGLAKTPNVQTLDPESLRRKYLSEQSLDSTSAVGNSEIEAIEFPSLILTEKEREAVSEEGGKEGGGLISSSLLGDKDEITKILMDNFELLVKIAENYKKNDEYYQALISVYNKHYGKKPAFTLKEFIKHLTITVAKGIDDNSKRGWGYKLLNYRHDLTIDEVLQLQDKAEQKPQDKDKLN